MRSMKFIQNYHNEHTKIEFGMLTVVILYELHTSHFAVYRGAECILSAAIVTHAVASCWVVSGYITIC